jgi:hypothetical protein
MSERLFSFSLLGKSLQWFYTQPVETVQNWEALMRAFMKEYYSAGKTQSLRNKFATFLNILRRLFWKLSSVQWVHLGRVRTMCGWRIGGWSLPGVMSDWQRYVDWFLAKYCRCRLRLDWCWCMWRTSAKGRCWWGLQVWRRQIGFVWGTRWPAESSASRMVARTKRWSHWRFLGWASKPRSSWDYMGAESWVAIGGGYTKFARFPVVHQKTTGFLGWSTKLRPKNRRRRCSNIGPVWPVGLTGLTGVQWRSPETSKRRTRVGIARLASRLSKFAVAGHPSAGAMTKTSEFALEGHVSLIS